MFKLIFYQEINFKYFYKGNLSNKILLNDKINIINVK